MYTVYSIQYKLGEGGDLSAVCVRPRKRKPILLLALLARFSLWVYSLKIGGLVLVGCWQVTSVGGVLTGALLSNGVLTMIDARFGVVT